MTVEKKTLQKPMALERLRQLGGDNLVAKMIQLFLEQTPLKVQRAMDAFAKGDIQDVAKAIHPLKSSAAYVGADALCKIAETLEHACRDQNSNVLADTMPQLESVAKEALTFLEDIKKEENI